MKHYETSHPQLDDYEINISPQRHISEALNTHPIRRASRCATCRLVSHQLCRLRSKVFRSSPRNKLLRLRHRHTLLYAHLRLHPRPTAGRPLGLRLYDITKNLERLTTNPYGTRRRQHYRTRLARQTRDHRNGSEILRVRLRDTPGRVDRI